MEWVSGVVLHLLLLPVLTLLVVGTGSVFLRLVRVPTAEEPAAERLAICFAVGAGVLTLLFGTLGHLMLNGWFLSAIAVLAAAGSWRTLVDAKRRWPGGLPTGWLERLILVVLALLILFGWAGTLSPEVRHDPLFYHLQIPQLWLNSGRMVEVPENGHSYFPYGYEMLYTWAIALGSESAAKGFHWLAGIAGALLAGRLARLTGAHPLHGAALYYVMPTIVYLSTSTYIDLATGMYGLLALSAWIQAIGGGWTVQRGLLLGFATGCAMATKYTAWPLLGVPLGVACLIALWRRPALLALVGVVTILPLLPWVVRNVVYVGNPVAPLLISVFGPQTAYDTGLAGSFDSFSGAGSGLGGMLMAPVGYARHLLLQKYTLALLGLLAAAALMASAARGDRRIVAMVVMFVGLFVVEAMATRGHPDGRYGLAMQGMAGVLVALVCARMASASGKVCVLAPGLALGLGVSALFTGRQSMNDLGERWVPMITTESREAYRRERNHLPVDFAARDAAILADGANRVLGISYPSRTRYWAWIQGIRNEPLIAAGGHDADAATIARALAAIGATHMVREANPGFADEAWQEFLERHTEPMPDTAGLSESAGQVRRILPPQ